VEKICDQWQAGVLAKFAGQNQKKRMDKGVKSEKKNDMIRRQNSGWWFGTWLSFFHIVKPPTRSFSSSREAL